MAGLYGIVDKWKEIESDTKQQFYIFKKGNEPFGLVMAPAYTYTFSHKLHTTFIPLMKIDSCYFSLP